METNKPIVYFDGSCPICRREIGYYRARPGAEDFDWTDVSACEGEMVAPDLSRGEAMARFHVRDGDGRLLSGAAAFARMWADIRGFRWLGRVSSWKGLQGVLEVGYRGTLIVRPWLQRRVAGRGARN